MTEGKDLKLGGKSGARGCDGDLGRGGSGTEMELPYFPKIYLEPGAAGCGGGGVLPMESLEYEVWRESFREHLQDEGEGGQGFGAGGGGREYRESGRSGVAIIHIPLYAQYHEE